MTPELAIAQHKPAASRGIGEILHSSGIHLSAELACDESHDIVCLNERTALLDALHSISSGPLHLILSECGIIIYNTQNSESASKFNVLGIPFEAVSIHASIPPGDAMNEGSIYLNISIVRVCRCTCLCTKFGLSQCDHSYGRSGAANDDGSGSSIALVVDPNADLDDADTACHIIMHIGCRRLSEVTRIYEALVLLLDIYPSESGISSECYDVPDI